LQIEITTSQNDGFFILQISDNGIGIRKDNQEKIFAMFKKGHEYSKGSEIGLYIVKRIIENEGGRIKVESEEGKGSTFMVYFKK
jgi:signal transduction histidine kinase